MINNVLAGIRDFLLIIVLMAVIIFGAKFLVALGELSDRMSGEAAPAVVSCDENPYAKHCTPPPLF